MNQKLKSYLFTIGFILLGGMFIAGVVADRTTDIQVDNTRKNVRDRQFSALTPLDQSNDRNDMAITQDIRKMLMKDENLSMNAKNIKVITQRRIATLRGPVESVAEKESIEKLALVVAGNGKVKNELEIKTN